MPVVSGWSNSAQDNGLDTHELLFHGGEEYEIVATISDTKIRLAETGKEGRCRF